MPKGRRQTLVSGPWKRVRNTTDPMDDPPDTLQDATNIYLPDPAAGCGVYQRPSFQRFGGISLGSQRAAGGWRHIMRDGTSYNFEAQNGKLYRVPSDFSSAPVDVTPVGVTIDPGLTTRVYLRSYNDELIVTDGVNRPWRGTNLGNSPITGTYIDLDGNGSAWTAYGPPTMFGGVLVFLTATVPSGSSIKPRVGITWCEPNQASVGYTQSGYTDFANIIQTSSRLLTGIWGTNAALFYFRDTEVGTASGIVDGSFASTNTQASISQTIGCVAPDTIKQYGDMLYFCDQFGRPQQLEIGGKITEPQLWLQLRQNIEQQTQAAGYQTALQNVSIGIVEPNLNVYLCAPYASGSFGVSNFNPTVIYAFDAKTGAYLGTWTVSNGVRIKGFCIWGDANGSDTLIALAESTAGNGDTYPWNLKRLSDNSWSDSDNAQTVNITTGRLGYQSDVVWDAGETATAVTMNAAQVAMTVQTPYTSSTSVGSVTPPTSQDSTYRVVWGMDTHAAREIRVTLTPALGATQWGAQQVKVTAVASQAGIADA